MALTDEDKIFSIYVRFPENVERVEFQFYNKDADYLIKLAHDPNYFTISAEKYGELNKILKDLL